MKSACVALLLVLTLCAGARAATIYVDSNAHADSAANGSAQHPLDTVQKAIAAAAKGDTIVVAPGHYLSNSTWAYGELKFLGKSVRLVSSAPTDFSVADQTVLCGVVIFDGTEDPNCLLQGFKVQNYMYGGILGNKTQAAISHCIISGNGPCGATVLKDVHGRVANCLIVDNTTFSGCGVLPVISGCPTLVNCTIANNLSGVEITNGGLPAGTPITIHNCIIWGNQGTQLIEYQVGSLPLLEQIDYCLLMADTSMPKRVGTHYGDPCFVHAGYWTDGPIPPAGTTSRATRGDSGTQPKTLIEGDYHLQSAGWRWSPQPAHGSNWFFDAVTSLGVSAGDPMDGLGEELDRAPGDPEGQWGFNHAIEIGAYGGTAQASLAPSNGAAPGVGTVDLRDYWPLDTSSAGTMSSSGGGTSAVISWFHSTVSSDDQWYVHDPQGTDRRVSVSGGGTASANGVTAAFSILATNNAPGWATKIYCHYANRTFYLTLDPPVPNPLPNQAPQAIQAQYPQYPHVGDTIQATYDPFASAGPQYRLVVIVRGTLAEVLAGTSMTPAQFLAGAWPDVIALREQKADGTAGDPIAIFARGFGPLLLAGQPIDGAIIRSKAFGNAPSTGTGTSTGTDTGATRATRG